MGLDDQLSGQRQIEHRVPLLLPRFPHNKTIGSNNFTNIIIYLDSSRYGRSAELRRGILDWREVILT
jgi:hypothetical protein